MQNADFSLSKAKLYNLAEEVLRMARMQGATACSVDISESYGLGVTVRLGELETIEHNRDKGLTVSVYVGKRRGHASATDFSLPSLQSTVSKAMSIARYSEEDPCAGLAEPHLLFNGELPELSLFFPWSIQVEEAMMMARACEQAALAVDPAIKNSDGASFNATHILCVSANSHGLMVDSCRSRYGLYCRVIAQRGDEMQADGWFSVARDKKDLCDPEALGRFAAERALSRLGARKIETCEAPVLFEAPEAAGLISAYVAAVSGDALYQNNSFLMDSLGQCVFPDTVNIREDPFLPKGMASSAFDADGVATSVRDVVTEGVNTGYFLSAYTARKLGMETTANAGGCHNLIVSHNGCSLAEMIAMMGRGLLVTELIGMGINRVTGDYSRGAAGFWVEQGEIAYPVQEVTIAGNLRSMLRGIVGIGADTMAIGSKLCGSILVNNMTIAGN